jgi:MFS family permease
MDGSSTARIVAVIVVIVLFTETLPLQYTMVQSAVQKIGPSFPTAGNNISWMMIILGLVGGATTPLVTKLADVHGKRNVMLWCVIGFLAGTVLCAITGSWPLFLVGRGLEAATTSAMAVASGLVRDLIPRRHIPIALGILATGIGLSGIAGPLLGGVLTDHYSWRSIFWFLVVYTVVLLPLFWWLVPSGGVRARQRIDWVGSALLGLGVAGVLLYVSDGQTWGWGRWSALVYLVGGLVLVGLFLWWTRRSAHPLMDLSLLGSPKMRAVLGVGAMATFATGVASYAIPYMLETSRQQVQGGVLAGIAKATHLPVAQLAKAVGFHGDLSYAGGLSLMSVATHAVAWSALLGIAAGPLVGAWTKRIGPRTLLAFGMCVFALSMVLFALFHGSWVQMLPGQVGLGISTGFFFACINNLVVEAVPAEQQAVGAGMLQLVDSIMQSVGIAALTGILVANPLRISMAGRPGSTPVPGVFTDTGWTVGFWCAAGACLIGAVIAWRMRFGRSPVTGGLAAG